MLRPFCPTLCISLALLLALPATGLAARQRSPSLTLEGVNAAELQQGKPSTPLLVKLQVLLDRAHASPGEIDGTLGENTRWVSASPIPVQRVSVSLQPERAFLKSVRGDTCGIFGTVLGPGADEAHKSHLHLDMKERRGGSFCQ
jgi:peptidoglycan hydrolase-like protein with peptidoglycan-binding domain